MVEAPSSGVDLVHGEQSMRAVDEGDQPVVTTTELLVLGREQQSLGGVGEPHTTITEVGLDIGTVEHVVGALEFPLEFLTRDEVVPHGTALPHGRVVVVGDAVAVEVVSVLTLDAELVDDVGAIRELQLDDPTVPLVGIPQERLEVLGVDVPAGDERPELHHLT